MKKIYSFTFSSDEYPSSSRKFAEDLRLIAHMVYTEIYNYYDENQLVLDINKDIEYNNLNDDYNGCKYMLDSDIYDDGYIYYEPFIVSNNTFCLTISDMSFGEENIVQVIDYVLKLLKLNYKVTIDSISYVSKNKDDEKYRDGAIKAIFNKMGCICNRKNRFIYSIMNNIGNKKRSRSINRKCFGYY